MIKIIFGFLYLAGLARGQNATSRAPQPPATVIVPLTSGGPPASITSVSPEPSFTGGPIGKGSSPVTSTARPQPQFCPRQEPGFLNDYCDDDHPCYSDYSLVCKDNKCSCSKNTIPSHYHNGLCEPAPSLNQPCDKACQVPLVCKGASSGDERNDTSSMEPTAAPPEANATSGTTTSTQTSLQAAIEREANGPLPPTPPQGNRCRCEPPYFLRNGHECRLECKPEEWYDASDGKCKPRCKADEVKLDDGSCVKVAKIGQPCQHDEQCTQAHARCAKDICGCQPGFYEDGRQCTANKHSCPWREPLPDSSGNIIPCNRTVPNYPYYERKDSCPKDGYCQGSENNYYPSSAVSGFCCPRPNISCPEGDPIPDTTCGPVYDPLAKTIPKKQCPSQTHYCHSVSVSDGYSESLCCPKPCRNSYILVEGVCYPPLQYGDACKVDEQCKSFNGECLDGTCKCPPNKQPPSGENNYCSISCGADEVLADGKCYKRLNLGDSCENKPSNLCPENAGCDENNKCSCFCNFIPLGNKRCGPYPICKKPSFPPSPIPLDLHGSSQSAPSEFNRTSTRRPEEGEGNSAPGADNSAATDKSKSSGNYTFCRLRESDAPPVPLVKRCPFEHFCNYYQIDIGLCCPIPDMTCADGSKSTRQQCQPPEVACGRDEYCYKFLEAPDEAYSRYTCCPNSARSTIT